MAGSVSHRRMRRVRFSILAAFVVALLGASSGGLASALSPPPLTRDEPVDHAQLEAVIATSMGEIVIEFLSEAPRHVENFIRQAQAGAYDRTIFHRVIEYGIIQGGDPLTKNPRARAQYGTGGLNAGIPAEINVNKHEAGAVSGVLAVDRANPNQVRPGSAGQQFFIVLNAGPAKEQLDRQFSVFARVVEGMDTVTEISRAPANRQTNLPNERIEITSVTLRPRTPSVEQMKAMTIRVETSEGDFRVRLSPESAPNTCRTFVRRVKSGLYDGTTFFRVSQGYFLEAGFLDQWPQDSPNRRRFFSLWPIPVERGNREHVRGTVSMRQHEGKTSWYFFAITKANPALDAEHVPIGDVFEGLDVLDRIAETDVEGDRPVKRIEIKRVQIEQG